MREIAKLNLCDPKTVLKYIGRYLGRPVMAISRIDHYDDDTVTFHYNRHEDNKYIDNLPEGLTSKDIRHMSNDELPDMYYFLNEDDLFADEAGVEGFYIF